MEAIEIMSLLVSLLIFWGGLVLVIRRAKARKYSSTKWALAIGGYLVLMHFLSVLGNLAASGAL